MPVTHSPGNPFVTKSQGRLYDLYTTGDGRFLGAPSPSETRHLNINDLQRNEYLIKELQEKSHFDMVAKDSRIEELELKLLDEGKKLERAESDKRFLFDLQANQAEEIIALKTETANIKSAADTSIRDYRSSCQKLREQLASLEDKSRLERQSCEKELIATNVEMSKQKKSAEALKEDLLVQANLLMDKNSLIAELEERCDKQTLGDGAEGSSSTSFLTKELSQALQTVQRLEATAATQVARLNQQQEAIAKLSVVREAKQALELKIGLMDAMRDELARAQLQIAELERQRVAWQKFLEDDTSVDAATALARQKVDLQALAAELKRSQAQKEELEAIIRANQSTSQTIETELRSCLVELLNEKRNCGRLEKSKILLMREIAFLREQLRSFDLEEQAESPKFDGLRESRILELETLVDEYRSQVSQLSSSEHPKETSVFKRERDEESNTFHDIERGEYLRKIRALNSELEIAQRKVDLLEQEVMAFNRAKQTHEATTMRILQHKSNPTSVYQAIRSQTLEDLRKENESLLAQMAGGTIVTVPIQTLRNVQNEVKRRDDVIAQKEKMILRLREVFGAKSSEFREAVHSLLGYKLDFLQNGRVRLTSMYAGKAEYAFLFDGEAGTMQLCGDAGADGALTDSIGNLIKFWSGEKNSIPGMLSALTLELLEKESRRDT